MWGKGMTDIQTIIEEYIKEMEGKFPNLSLTIEEVCDGGVLIIDSAGKLYHLSSDSYSSCYDRWSGVCTNKEVIAIVYSTDDEDGYIDETLVEDIWNIQPHECGILKLKYNLDPEDVYVPEFAKRIYNGGGNDN